MDSQTSDTQYFGFEAAVAEESQITNIEGFERRRPLEEKKTALPSRELNIIIAAIRRTREDLNALEDELVAACFAVAGGGHQVRIHLKLCGLCLERAPTD